MPWLAATAVIEAARADALSDALIESGAASVEVSDADAGTAWERPIFDEAGGACAPAWARARVSALFAPGVDVGGSVGEALRAAGLPEATAYELARIEDDDWVRRTQSQFAPLEVAPRLWVVPTWHALPDPGAVNIVLDPGLAFGTGTHPTTRLCLRWLARSIAGGESILDFGCGSGILAIAALKLGAGSAQAVDIDPQALTAASRNAARNGVELRVVAAAERLKGAADIVVANILSQPLVVLAPLLTQLSAPQGRIALSGILREQSHEVMSAYRPWYDFAPVEEEDGWVLLVGTRR
jgi:ribosomal protein L11 methyltransferase